MPEQIKMSMDGEKQNKVFYITAIIATLVLVWILQIIFWPVNLPEKTSVIIKKGDGLSEIGQSLKQAGIIRSNYLFQTYVVLRGRHNDLIAGAYEMQKANMPGVLDKLIKGEIAETDMVFIEGWSLNNLANWLAGQNMFSSEELFAFTGEPAVDLKKQEGNAVDWVELKQNFEFLNDKPDCVSLEGFLFPDTYQIKKSETIEQIVFKMLENFKDKTNDLREKAKEQGKDFFEVLTIASLLEKEVKTYEEKQIVAGILWKRLANGWKLQVDAVLTYLIKKTSLDLTDGDLGLDSPYNVYKYYGLPLGPICNPGLESLTAALYYKRSPYWFYLTDKEGKAIFSSTLSEHNNNRNKYLK